MTKKSLSERDICTKYITPAIVQTGWDMHSHIREEVSLTNGRIIVRGKLHTRGQRKRADYVLYHKPLTIGEFDLEKDWWGGAERKKRQTTEYAWKVSAKDIVADNYNLDSKNPYEEHVELGDPDEFMAEFQDISHRLAQAQQALKNELLAALKRQA